MTNRSDAKPTKFDMLVNTVHELEIKTARQEDEIISLKKALAEFREQSNSQKEWVTILSSQQAVTSS